MIPVVELHGITQTFVQSLVSAFSIKVLRIDHGQVVAHFAVVGDVVRVVIAEGIHAMPIGEGLVPMFEGVAIGVQNLEQAVVAQQYHVVHFVASGKRGMGRHDETAPFA